MQTGLDPKQAMAKYCAAFELRGIRSLPELFDAAPIRFDFSESMRTTLMAAVQGELESLPQS